MKLVLYNGSPRNKKSNSMLLIDNFLNGYNQVHADEVPIHHLASLKKREEAILDYSKADCVLIVFPLYTDCMPGLVKEFFEEIANLKLGDKKLGFVVHSGFPEAIHSTFVEKYLEKFTKRTGNEYLGTIIKGGTEGIQIMPGWMTKKLFGKVYSLGVYFAKHQGFDRRIINQLAKPFKLSVFRRGMLQIMSKTGMANMYWNTNLKKNKAFEKRFARPFAN